MNKPNKTELEYFIRYSLDSDKYKRYMELYDEIERLNKELNTYKYRPKTRFRDVIELRDKINKAIDKLNNMKDTYYESNMANDMQNIFDLLDILKGVDKE